MHINPNIEKPIFIQIAEQLEDSIFTKVFPEETKIPSTNELSSLLNINPHTVLKGMNLLVDEEIIYKKRGLGMFVKKGAVNKILLKRQSQFYEQYVALIVYSHLNTLSILILDKEYDVSVFVECNWSFCSAYEFNSNNCILKLSYQTLADKDLHKWHQDFLLLLYKLPLQR